MSLSFFLICGRQLCSTLKMLCQPFIVTVAVNYLKYTKPTRCCFKATCMCNKVLPKTAKTGAFKVSSYFIKQLPVRVTARRRPSSPWTTRHCLQIWLSCRSMMPDFIDCQQRSLGGHICLKWNCWLRSGQRSATEVRGICSLPQKNNVAIWYLLKFSIMRANAASSLTQWVKAFCGLKELHPCFSQRSLDSRMLHLCNRTLVAFTLFKPDGEHFLQHLLQNVDLLSR